MLRLVNGRARESLDLLSGIASDALRELFAPGVPDVLGLAQAPREGDFAEAAMGRELFLKDLLDIVNAQRHDAAEQLANARSLIHLPRSFPGDSVFPTLENTMGIGQRQICQETRDSVP